MVRRSRFTSDGVVCPGRSAQKTILAPTPPRAQSAVTETISQGIPAEHLAAQAQMAAFMATQCWHSGPARCLVRASRTGQTFPYVHRLHQTVVVLVRVRRLSTVERFRAEILVGFRVYGRCWSGRNPLSHRASGIILSSRPPAPGSHADGISTRVPIGMPGVSGDRHGGRPYPARRGRTAFGGPPPAPLREMLGEAGVSSAQQRTHDCARPVRLNGSDPHPATIRRSSGAKASSPGPGARTALDRQETSAFLTVPIGRSTRGTTVARARSRTKSASTCGTTRRR